MSEDEVARQLLDRHIQDCDKRMERIEEMFNEMWGAIDAFRNWRTRLLQGAIGFLLMLTISLVGYIWKTGGHP